MQKTANFKLIDADALKWDFELTDSRRGDDVTASASDEHAEAAEDEDEEEEEPETPKAPDDETGALRSRTKFSYGATNTQV